MAIRKQNAALLSFIVIVLAGLGYVLVKEGKLSQFYSQENEEQVATEVEATESQEALGDQIDSASGNGPGTIEKQKTFSVILDDLGDCLSIKGNPAEATPISIESIVSLYQSELGVSNGQSDRWMNWHLRNRDGKEKRLRLEVTEDETGRSQKILHYYSVDRAGQPTAIDLDDSRRENPSDDTITTMLREGEVFYKDRAGYVTFPGGERIEYVEKNGELAEIEFIKGESFFRCGDLNSRENCQCTK